MTGEAVLEWVDSHKLKPCPFCGEELEFYHEKYINKHGKQIQEMYYMHIANDCVLNEIMQPFTLGCGNSVEYAELWNKRSNIMCMYLTCSNCGQHQILSDSDEILKIINDGWGSFGSALYCPECCKTWGERNSNAMSDSNNTLRIIFDEFLKNLK